MGMIYQNAFEVVIWLGSASGTSEYVMDAVANFDIQRIQSQNRYRLVGPCFVPPSRRDVFMNNASASGRTLDEFQIV